MRGYDVKMLKLRRAQPEAEARGFAFFQTPNTMHYQLTSFGPTYDGPAISACKLFQLNPVALMSF